MFEAITEADVDELRALADLHANFNCRDSEGHCPIHRAADRNNADVRYLSHFILFILFSFFAALSLSILK